MRSKINSNDFGCFWNKLADSNSNFVAAEINSEIFFGCTVSSSHKAAASKVSFLFGHPSSRETGVGHVSSRPSHLETEAELDRESVATLFSSLPRGKRDRELNFVHALRDRDTLEKILERNVDLAIQGEKRGSAKIVSCWSGDWGEEHGKEKSRSFFSRDQSRVWISAISLESRGLVGKSGSEREKMRLYGELELRNRLFQKYHARDCREIEELKGKCCEQIERTRKAGSE